MASSMLGRGFVKTITNSRITGRLLTPVHQEIGRRFLFSDEILGLEGYRRQRIITNDRVRDMRDQFCQRMEEYMKSADKNTIFTDDLKTMVNMAESEEELDIAWRMIQRYASQDTLRFGVFQFGPIVMRLFHFLKKPELAFEAFKNDGMGGFFDQMSSYLVLMDLLFENQMYDQVLETYDIITNRLLDGVRFPRDCSTIALAACYRKDGKEMYEKAKIILKQASDRGSDLPVRGLIFSALQALNQGYPSEGYEILANVSERRFIGALNAKAMMLAALNRTGDAISMINSVLYEERPDFVKTRRDIFPETMECVRKSVESANQSDLVNKFQTVEKDLQRLGYLTEKPFMEFILDPVIHIAKLKTEKNSFKSRERSAVGSFLRPRAREHNDRRRAGIRDLE